MKNWTLHVCLLDKDCRENSALFGGKSVNRVHVTTPWAHVGVALARHSRFARGLRATWIDVRRNNRG